MFYRDRRVLQAGVVPKRAFNNNDAANNGEQLLSASENVPELGAICKGCMASGSGNYLANLALFPGRVEFQSFLPENTQAVVVTPIGGEGVVVAASGTQRGFTPADQAWMSVIAEKLDQTLSGEQRA